MSKPLGRALPESLYARWHAAERTAGLVVVVHSIDEQGFAHPALLSEFEVLALAPDRLRLAAGRGSRTAANIRERKRVTLSAIEPEGVYYIKALLRAEKTGAGHSDFFELEVAAVLWDEAREEETGTRFLTGLRFSADAKAMSYFEEVFRALRGAEI